MILIFNSFLQINFIFIIIFYFFNVYLIIVHYCRQFYFITHFSLLPFSSAYDCLSPYFLCNFYFYRRINGWRRRWCTYRLSQVVHTHILNNWRGRHHHWDIFKNYFLPFLIFYIFLLNLIFFFSSLVFEIYCNLCINNIDWYGSCESYFNIHFRQLFYSLFLFLSFCFRLISIYLRIYRLII